MRQAGRYLPEYRKLKKKYGFLKLIKTPELATEVTLQPLARFELDAAIVFSDILVVPEAMGQPYAFRNGGGIKMEYRADTETAVESLSTEGLEDRLSYVPEALGTIKGELGGKKALIGFSGSPWTLATYMVEGGSSKYFSRVKTMFFRRPDLFGQLLTKITESVTRYLHMQIEAGVDAVQIFDSWAGILSPYTFWKASAQYMADLVRSVDGKIPVIVFSRGAHHWIDDLRRIGADVLGVDWTYHISQFHDALEGNSAVQGNLDPSLLDTTPKIVEAETVRILKEMNNRSGHIFNLGHGIHPEAKIECVEALVETVQQSDQTGRTS